MIHLRVIESVYSEVPGARSARAAGNYSTLVVFFAISMVKYANLHLPVKQIDFVRKYLRFTMLIIRRTGFKRV